MYPLPLFLGLALPLVAQATVTETQKVTAFDRSGGSQFGADVALSSDTFVIGAPSEDSVAVDSGAVYVFQPDSTGQYEQVKITSPAMGVQDWFGRNVELSGDTLVVGARGVGNGTVYIFQRTAGVWSLGQTLPNPSATGATFFSMSLSIDQDLLVLGDLADDAFGFRSGAAYVYRLNSGTWTQETKLTASDGHSSAYFGGSVAVDNETIIVGAPGPSTSAAAGSAYIFSSNGSTWTEDVILSHPDTNPSKFGQSVGF